MQTTLVKSQLTPRLLPSLMTCFVMVSFSATSSTLVAAPILTDQVSMSEPSKSIAQETILLPLTPHTAQYKAYYGSIELGDAKYTLPATDSGYYNYLFESEVGLLMLSDERKLQSDFTLENGKLVPFRYIHDRTGTGSDYTEQTAFAKSQNFIHTIYKQEALKLDYQELIFDPLMVQLQFRMDVIGNKRPLNYKMVKEKEVDEYDFKVIGNETITVAGGTFETVKFEVVRDSTKRQTFFWMAPKLAYLPIRLSHFSKGSKQLDIQLATYHFDKPLTDVPSLDIVHEHKIFDAYMTEKSLLRQGDTTQKVITDDEDFPEVSQDNVSEKEILEIKKMVID